MSQQNPDFLYVADSQNQVIRQIKISTREVTTLAGQVQEPVYRDGTGSAAGFYNPSAVVVDDHDMGVTHVIRGDDHLNNAFRQLQIIKAMGWPEPVYAHIPLIHGADGAKLSKRHGALGVDAYRDMGFLPAALRNYLLRLGWGHGDDEIISTAQAIEWFDLPGVGRSASRFDMVKLTNLNSHYVRETPDRELIPLVLPLVEKRIGGKVDSIALQRIERGMPGVKQRAHTLVELADSLLFYARHGSPAIVDDKARALLTAEARSLLGKLAGALDAQAADWGEKQVEDAIRHFAEAQGVKLGQVAQPLRVALTGSTASPGISRRSSAKCWRGWKTRTWWRRCSRRRPMSR